MSPSHLLPVALLLGCSAALAGAAESAPHRSALRIRDPFVLPDPASGTYYIYTATTQGIDSAEPRKGVDVYRSKDLDHWEGPTPVFEVPAGFWADQAVWAPEVHRYRGRYYLFVTLTSKQTLPTPPGRPPNVRRGTQIFVADKPTGPFQPISAEAQTPADWMALDGTLFVEAGVPYMVFCHEWIQITDGSMDLVRLTDDLACAVGEPRPLFHASAADWVRCRGDLGELFQGKRYHAYITDGAWFYRTKTGRLLMIWSSYGPRKYATGVAWSASGKVAGPWVQQPEPLFADDGGHGMIFNTFDGRTVLVLHQPNRKVERARFFAVEDLGDTIRLGPEITDFSRR